MIFSPTAEGSFTDAAIFTSNDGSSTNSVTGSSAIVPVAGFNASPTSGHWPLTVSFSSTSTGTITNLFWDFGDGSTTNTGLANPIHVYTGANTNTVTLTASGPAGTDTLTLARPSRFTLFQAIEAAQHIAETAQPSLRSALP